MQGDVHRVEITTLDNRRDHLCLECDALWDTPGEITDDRAWADFTEFMEKRGLTGMWWQVKVLG